MTKATKVDVTADFQRIHLNRNRDNGSKIFIKYKLSLNDYCNSLFEFDKKVKEISKYSLEMQNKLNDESLRFLMNAYLLESTIDKKELNEIRKEFRNRVANFIFQSSMIKRYFEKPLGYPGDFQMFELLYDNVPISNGIGKYFDNFIIKYSLAQAVINRKNFIKKIILETITKFKTENKNIKISNFGCGGCREVRELLNENLLLNKVSFNFIDQEEKGLSLAKRKLINTKDMQFNFIKENVLNMVGFGPSSDKYILKEQDLVYSLGLIDYFLDNVLEKFIKKVYVSLKNGGRFIIASCSSRRSQLYLFLTWYSDWFFYTRNSKETEQLVKKWLNSNNVRIFWEKSNNIFFIDIRK